MTIEPQIKKIIEDQLEVMIKQTKAYLPFIKLAFPSFQNLADVCFGMIVANTLSTFMTQCGMRLRSPTKEDFSEFGEITTKYREKINKMF